MKLHTYIERYKFLLLAGILLFSAMLVETNYFNQHFNKQHADLFQKIIHAKEQYAEDISKQVFSVKNNDFEAYKKIYQENKRLINNQKISFFVYTKDSLTYWNNNKIIVPDSIVSHPQKYSILFLNNIWYLNSFQKKDSVEIFILSEIKTEYPFENKYITNKFHSDFSINRSIRISTTPTENSYNIYLQDGSFLLGLSKNHGRADNTLQRYLSIMLYLIGIIFLLIFMHLFLIKIKKRLLRDIINYLFFALLIIIRYWMLENQIPYVCYTTDLFSSDFYAASDYTPSLGDLLINLLFFLYFIHQIQLRIRDWKPTKSISIYTSLIVFSLISVALFSLTINICESIVYDSTINLELYKLLNTSFLSYIAYAIIGIMMFSYFLILFAGYNVFSTKIDLKKYLLIPATTILFSIILYYFGFVKNPFYFIIFQLIIHGIFIYKANSNKLFFTKTFRFSLLFIVALFLQIYLHEHIHIKQTEIKKLLAVNLTNEQDPVAEILLRDIKLNMKKDSELQTMLQQKEIQDAKINTYLQQKYYSGFLNRYSLESTVCGTSQLFAQPNKLKNCELYFSNIISKYGIKLSNNDYYFLNNQNGSISYFDSLTYNWKNGTTTKLYIELNSKRISQELGYPELLLEENLVREELFEYSYAKYVNTKLVSQKGDFPYSLEIQNLPALHSYKIITENNIEHIIYRANKNTCIIISNTQANFFNHLVSFSYVFIFFFLLLLVYDLNKSKSLKHIISFKTFTDKIKLSLFSIVFASLLLTGISLVILNIHQYSEAQKKHVKEKMQSIIIELSDDISTVNNIYTIQNLLSTKLLRFANTYFTDINIYNTNGYLIASSRPEIFTYKLTSKKINSEAFYHLAILKKQEFLHKESIEGLQYTSAYASITNADNSIVGYINLPYFSKQAELTQQISSLIVAILNIFVILIMLSTVLAAFLSNKITYPLQILRDKMKLVKIGNRNEKISWKTSDEIGDLIENYNSMIDQLESSAQKLAETEREGAWHEMAKQIAHEIKNPLTPMKLNIQLLHKAWEQKDPEFEKRLKVISNSIIEQIETLAETANSFSDFARISEGKPEDIELTNLLLNTVTLFKEEKNITIQTDIPDEKIFLYTDKDKIVRVFNNILKNAIQSIPPDKSGNIRVSIKKPHASEIFIEITDNGKGISNEIKDKLFSPNFTTKSTGSGLGLAICKKIIENIKGEIWFESTENKGTTFFIRIPSVKIKKT
ncbi:MAG: ATP-binding protein [Bacteroidales bacterium]|nr:ATP-binding protein [Bacteroidales bacterium]